MRHDKAVEVVAQYKYLPTLINDNGYPSIEQLLSDIKPSANALFLEALIFQS